MNIDDIKNTVKSQLKEHQFVVDIKQSNSNQIFVYIDDFNGLTIDECRRISKSIESVFDREVEDYSLEVSSPGLDKPFKVIEQYKKNINKEIKLVLKDGISHEGILTSIDADGLNLTVKKKLNKKETIDTTEYFNFNQIKKANLKIDF
ncbi:MAG TPA: ribosome assembly cofactor RimP [Bacteroidales bacterium]|jgi:ribosome maturation factor RimP|nr:ribosome assembly cofactor RimP [Bacteroidales bacterium]MDD4235558.1 ribosome assembly cofactor RimP [Bacteroidales bacterium]MDY0159851.1 ribosome assembly cofactor RimP [Bacteroidales bacterium]HXK81520.1 ribosome assembly cofactor RimP [Bacteroidales bacterium]